MNLVEPAVKYAKLGWSVFPIRAADDPHPDDPKNDKRPYVKWKPLQTKAATENQIRKWWSKFPKARIGVVTGKVSNLVVIDFDQVAYFSGDYSNTSLRKFKQPGGN